HDRPLRDRGTPRPDRSLGAGLSTAAGAQRPAIPPEGRALRRLNGNAPRPLSDSPPRPREG
ncbi:MAG: hypothetical protein AAFZ09_19675, partial [Pseudomonadota bacterium]